MKKLNTILVLLVFLMSLVPVAFAEEGTDSKDSIELTREKMREGVNAVKDDVTAIRAKTMARDATGRFEAIRMHQKERLMHAIEICREKGLAPERCEDMFQRRMDLVAKLSEKDLERLTRIGERKAEHEKDLDNLEKEEGFRKFAKEEVKARKIAPDRIENARGKLKQAEETFTRTLKEHKESREKAAKLKDVLKECENSDTDECRQKLVSHKEDTKTFLLNAADAVIAQLEKIKARVQSSEDLSEEEANELLSRIDAQIAEVREARASVEALTSESSREDIKEAAQKIRVAWGNIKHDVEKGAEKLINARIGGIIVRSKHLETKLNRILERMAEEGRDTSSVESLVDEFNVALDEAKQYYDQSLEKYKTFKDGKDEAVLKEAKELRNKAHLALKKAHEALKQIHRELKAQGKDKELESDEEDSVEEEAEDAVEDSEDEDDEDETEDGDEE